MTAALPTLAMVTCVRNEEKFLPAFLAYHRALGVHRAYIYLDRSTDRSREFLLRHPWVTLIERDQSDATTHLMFHQQQCADDALLRSRSDGCDWLLMLDADEFAWGGNLPEAPSFMGRILGRGAAIPEEGSLARLAAGARAETETILLSTAEVVPEVLPAGADFTDLQNFQTGERPLVRPIADPVDGTIRELGRWIGHRFGKAMVRTTCDAQAFDSHVWTRRQDKVLPDRIPLATERRGWLLHYVVTGAAHWRRKYSQLAFEADCWPRGEIVEFPKQAWKVAASRMTEAQAEDYFRTWVATPPRLIRAARRAGIVKKLSIVGDILRAAGFSADVKR